MFFVLLFMAVGYAFENAKMALSTMSTLPFQTTSMLTDLEKNAIRDHYQNIGKNLPGFRPRASQRDMIAAVANAFSRTLTRE